MGVKSEHGHETRGPVDPVKVVSRATESLMERGTVGKKLRTLESEGEPEKEQEKEHTGLGQAWGQFHAAEERGQGRDRTSQLRGALLAGPVMPSVPLQKERG